MTYDVPLQPTGATEPRECPACRAAVQMVVMAPAGAAPLDMHRETIFRCPRCERLSIPAGVVKRVGGLLLIVPFLGMLAAALGAGVWFLWGMFQAGAVEPGFVVIALILIAAGALGGRLALRTLLRLLRPGSLLLLNQKISRFGGEKGNIYEGEL